jgi:hypothetical protein
VSILESEILHKRRTDRGSSYASLLTVLGRTEVVDKSLVGVGTNEHFVNIVQSGKRVEYDYPCWEVVIEYTLMSDRKGWMVQTASVASEGVRSSSERILHRVAELREGEDTGGFIVDSYVEVKLQRDRMG